jgi:hypothetical protein
MLTSGRAVRSARFSKAFALADDEQAVCFISIGTGVAARHGVRPTIDELLGDWTAGPAAPAGAAGSGASAPGTSATALPAGGHDTGAAHPATPGAGA